MKLFFTLLLSCSIIATYSQVYPSSCTPTPTMVNTYQNDVVKTATHRLFEINSGYKDSIDIPNIYKDSVARVFYAIYNMPGSSLRDTILNLFAYQNYSTTYGPNYFETDSLHINNNGYNLTGTNNYQTNFSPKNVDMFVADTTTWAAQWQSGNYTNTNNPVVNSLASKYAIIVTSFYTGFPGFYHITARTGAAVNTYGLAKSFNTITNNPQSCHALTYVGDGNSIQLVYENDGIKIIYNNNCGDCPAGCTYGRNWRFKVYYSNCNVEYLGAANLGGPSQSGNPVFTCTRGPVLPLTFGSITGYLQSGKAAINWKVLTQINVKEYIIERSDNGQQFYVAGSVPATNAQTADYTWQDAALLISTAWYRIKAVDLDGKTKYSSIVKISSVAKGNSFTVYPNPVVSRTFTIRFGTPVTGQMQAGLYSIDGKKVWATTLNLTPQTSSHTLTLPAAIQPGVYSFVVNSNNALYRQTMVVNGE